MWLFFSSVSTTGEISTHGFCSPELEDHLEALNHFVASGGSLLSAFLAEKGQRLDLPLEAFDGRPVREYIRELQEQYRHALSS
ncbi:hypothetical protein [Larkinella arboricola]